MASKDSTKSVATPAENDRLEHSVGGVTTRNDALDSGVPMLPGDPSEPQGPEDALGMGPKRGDYSQVIGNKQHYHSVPNPNYDREDPTSPAYVLVHQNPLVEDIGDEAGVKGGTHPLSEAIEKTTDKSDDTRTETRTESRNR